MDLSSSTVTELVTSTITVCADCVDLEVLWILIVSCIVAFILAFGVGANDVANNFASSIGSGVITLRNACIIATIFEMAGAILIVGIVIAAFIVSFALAFGIGANDVANSFGTSVGSRVLTLTSACFLATVMEISGAILLGHKVSDTIRKGIVDLDEYQNTPEEYMLGNLAALGGSAIWLLVATFLNMPISGTHSIVGSVLGFSLVARGLNGINWLTLGKIVGSWFVSPVLSGIVSGSIYFLIRKFILQKPDPISPGLISLPIFYGLTVFINSISILLDGPEVLKIEIGSLPSWTETVFGLLIAITISIIVAVLIAVLFVPRLRRKIREIIAQSPKPGTNNEKTDPSTNDKPNTINNNNNNTVDIFTIGLSSNNNNYDSKNPNFDNDVDKKTEEILASSTRSTPTPPPVTGINNISYTTNELNHNNTNNLKNKYLQAAEIEAIPMGGLTPNGSGVPLIIETESKGLKSKDLAIQNYELEYEDGGITFGGQTPTSVEEESQDDRPGVGKLFSFLQIMTAAFGSFAHGGNDVSNAIGPLIALYLVYKEGRIESEAGTPMWLLIFGGLGISLGLWIWGRRVIKTMGEDLTKITPSSGFTIEIGSAMTVLVASKIGIPVSTTHCKVGSVVFVGWLRTSGGGVDWTLFRNIIFAWVVTLPISAGLSALLMWILRTVVL